MFLSLQTEFCSSAIPFSGFYILLFQINKKPVSLDTIAAFSRPSELQKSSILWNGHLNYKNLLNIGCGFSDVSMWRYNAKVPFLNLHITRHDVQRHVTSSLEAKMACYVWTAEEIVFFFHK